MQASVHQFEQDGSGTVLLDSGVIHPFTPEVFAASGLRLLRIGQRLSVEFAPTSHTTADPLAATAIVRLWIVGIGDGERIA
ncbi:MAG: hypothetical protein WBG36_09545 [Ornithinimicrobium sp.]